MSVFNDYGVGYRHNPSRLSQIEYLAARLNRLTALVMHCPERRDIWVRELDLALGELAHLRAMTFPNSLIAEPGKPHVSHETTVSA